MSYRVKIEDMLAKQPSWLSRTALDRVLRDIKSVEGAPVWVEGDEIVTDSPTAILALIDGVVELAEFQRATSSN